MAGIGFVLRRLLKKDDLAGLIQAYTHATFASAGPWLCTVITIALVVLLSSYFVSSYTITEFRIIVIYNFGFSLVISGPIFMVTTRYLADAIYCKDLTRTSGLLIGTMALQYMIQLPLGCWFYFFYAELTDGMALSALVNFMLVGTIWLIAVFLTALKDYKTVSFAFIAGIVLTVTLGPALAEPYGAAGILNGFNIGIATILAVLFSRILVEYRCRLTQIFHFIPFMKRYWELTMAGLLYNMGIWIDKWIMWTAPEAETLPNNMVSYPDYDSGMFLAYITIVPSMAMFIVSIETEFFEHYLRFYREIQRKINFNKILDNQKTVVISVLQSCGKFLVLQGSICLIAILLAPQIFKTFGMSPLQIGIFRYGTLGALFHALFLFLTIVLSYFDSRRTVVAIYAFFFAANGIFTYLFMQLGFHYYGYGYCLASILTFAIAAFITARYMNELPYHAFISSNNSINTKPARTTTN